MKLEGTFGGPPLPPPPKKTMWIIMRFQVEKTLQAETNKKTHKISLFWVLFFGPFGFTLGTKALAPWLMGIITSGLIQKEGFHESLEGFRCR
jgi:hypothetical protein